MRPIPQAAIDLVQKWEGLRLTAYPDPGSPSGEPITIGYGHTDPGHIRAGDKIPPGRAVTLLRQDLTRAGTLIAANIGPVVGELTENQYAALLSFVFNVGASPGWTIWKRLKARQFDQVPGELVRFVNADGKKMQGLVNRRAAEAALFTAGEPRIVEAQIPSGITRLMDTPPTPTDPVPASKSATLLTTALGVIASVPVAVNALLSQLGPWAAYSPMLGQVVSGLAVIAAGAGIVALVLGWLKKREARR